MAGGQQMTVLGHLPAWRILAIRLNRRPELIPAYSTAKRALTVPSISFL